MPVRPQRCRVRMEEVDGDLELSYRRPVWATGCFLQLWITGWSVGCVMLVWRVLTQPTLLHILFAVPFLASWFFVFFLLLCLFFGAERLRLGIGGLDYRWSVLVTLWRRHVPLAEVKHARRGLADTRSQSDNPSRDWCVIVETVGEPLEFGRGRGMSEKEQHWLVAVLIERLLARFADILAALRREIADIPLSLPVPTSRPAAVILKRYEDVLDALVCAWVGTRCLRGGIRSYGDAVAAI